MNPVPGSVEATVTVRLDGDLDRNAITAMRAEFDRAVSPSTTAIVVDLTGVRFLSLEAAGMLLQVARQCRDLQLQLRVVPSPTVTRTLTMLGLHGIIPTSSAE
jgi:anti-anti-sigma factor